MFTYFVKNAENQKLWSQQKDIKSAIFKPLITFYGDNFGDYSLILKFLNCIIYNWENSFSIWEKSIGKKFHWKKFQWEKIPLKIFQWNSSEKKKSSDIPVEFQWKMFFQWNSSESQWNSTGIPMIFLLGQLSPSACPPKNLGPTIYLFTYLVYFGIIIFML